MKIFVTGATGTLGRELLPLLLKGNHEVWALRHRKGTDIEHPNLKEVKGDVVSMEGMDDIEDIPFDRVIHTAATVALGRHNSECQHINGGGTLNVLHWAAKRKIPQIEHVSTAYLKGRNPYEQSKKSAENFVEMFGRGYAGTLPPVHYRLIRPSILLSSSGSDRPTGAFYQFIGMAAGVHRRAEVVRRYVEGKLRLPPVRPLLRVRGDPDGTLNLIMASDVARRISNIVGTKTSHKIYWLTNPNPVRLGELFEWMGEALLVDLKLVKEPFEMSAVEALFARMASPFLPYLQGGINLPSDMDPVAITPITRDLIKKEALAAIL